MRSESLLTGASAELGGSAAKGQQQQARDVLADLETWSRDLDGVVADAVHSALMEAAGLRATEKLSQVHQATAVRFARWSLGIVGTCALVPALAGWMLLPSRAQISAARRSVEQLSAQVERLSREGGRIELKHCGEAQRLCARVDRKALAYGQNSDFMILKGY